MSAILTTINAFVAAEHSRSKKAIERSGILSTGSFLKPVNAFGLAVEWFAMVLGHALKDSSFREFIRNGSKIRIIAESSLQPDM